MSCLNHELKRKKVRINQVLLTPSGPVGNQNLSGEIPIPSADETLTPPEIPAVPSSSTPSSSTQIPISPGASSSSGVKRTSSESTALPNSPGFSSGSGVKRAHGESIVTDEDEQPGTRAQISILIAGQHSARCCGR